MLSSKYWCYLQTCGNLWYFSWHRRIHWVYDWVYNHRASLLHVWCRSAYYSWQVSLLKVLDAVRYIVIYCLLRLICYSNIPTLSDWAQHGQPAPHLFHDGKETEGCVKGVMASHFSIHVLIYFLTFPFLLWLSMHHIKFTILSLWVQLSDLSDLNKFLLPCSLLQCPCTERPPLTPSQHETYFLLVSTPLWTSFHFLCLRICLF